MADGIREGLEKLKSQRAEAAEEAKPEGEVVDVSEDTPEEEEEVTTSETEELETLDDDSETEEEDSEESQAIVYEIDGTETTLAEILEWKAGHMKDADYRKKTMTLADDRKAVEALSVKQSGLLETLQAQIDMLEEATDSEFKDIDWADLRDTHTAEYLKLKERKDGKKGKLDKAKSDRQKMLDDKRNELASAEWAKLSQVSGWDDQAKQKADMELLQGYLKAQGWTNDEFSEVVNHKNMTALLDAARYRELKSKAPATTKKVKKAPTVVRGKKASVTGIQTQINEARAKLKKTGKVEDAMTLRKLERQA